MYETRFLVFQVWAHIAWLPDTFLHLLNCMSPTPAMVCSSSHRGTHFLACQLANLLKHTHCKTHSFNAMGPIEFRDRLKLHLPEESDGGMVFGVAATVLGVRRHISHIHSSVLAPSQ